MSNRKIKKLFKTSFESLQEVKGQNIIALDLSHSESYTDFVLIASGTSDRQVKALGDRVIANAFKKCQAHPLGVEGYESAHWILIDFGDVICHVFFDEARSHYQLEDMWHMITPMKEVEIEKFLQAKKSPVKKKVPPKQDVIKKSVGRK